jgi:SAM-dependent methyltransferase
MPAVPGKFYGDVVASIHDQGFTDFVRRAAPGVIGELRRGGIRGGRILDLGCGSGPLSQALLRAGYEPWGLDVSRAMIALARRRVRGARFAVGAIEAARLPRAAGAAAVGEILNYLPSAAALRRAFSNVRRAIGPRGIFIFDLCVLAAPHRVGVRQAVRIEPNFAIVARVAENGPRRTKSRTMTAFVRRGAHYARADEHHLQRLYRSADVARWLRQGGFRVRVLRGSAASPSTRTTAYSWRGPRS